MNCLAGAPDGDYLSRVIVNRRGAPIADIAFMGLTSCRRITITQDASTPAERERNLHVPTAISRSNVPPTASP